MFCSFEESCMRLIMSLLVGSVFIVQTMGRDVVIERGPFHNVVQDITEVTDQGVTVILTNSTYTHLEAGLNRKDETGNWIAASDHIEITQTGAVARHGQ